MRVLSTYEGQQNIESFMPSVQHLSIILVCFIVIHLPHPRIRTHLLAWLIAHIFMSVVVEVGSDALVD